MSFETAFYFHYLLMQNACGKGLSTGNEIKSRQADIAEMNSFREDEFALLQRYFIYSVIRLERSISVSNKLLHHTLTVADYTVTVNYSQHASSSEYHNLG